MFSGSVFTDRSRYPRINPSSLVHLCLLVLAIRSYVGGLGSGDARTYEG